jgi:cytochrome c oxidase subunit IV
MSEHIVPVRIYLMIFFVLLVGTALTVAAAFIDFPWRLNTIVALTIATVKATFVVLYFMHVRYSARLVWVIIIAALFWMAILFAFTFSDYFTRRLMSTQLG